MLRPHFLMAAMMVLPAVAAAQGTPRPQAPAVPRHMLPPAGKCRIWMEGVAPEQQPAPTDCQTALRQKPANGTVIFGPSEREVTPSNFRSAPQTPARDSATRRPLPTRGRTPTPRPLPDTTKPPAAGPLELSS